MSTALERIGRLHRRSRGQQNGQLFAFRHSNSYNNHSRKSSPDHYRPSIERFEMRSVLLCILLVVSSSTPGYGQQPKSITNSIGMKLVLIHAGSFTMGSPEEEIGRKSDETQHEVTISKSYYLGVYEVTQEQYEKVMGSNPSTFKGAKNPVETVTWDDAVSFCKKLSDMSEEKAKEREYRLPTESEWEYACRATSGSAYCFGNSEDSFGEYAWVGEGALGTTHPVGEKKPSRWGLYDMHGNVFEWCQDWVGEYPSGAATDPRGPGEGSSRGFRGGSWLVDAPGCRSADRRRYGPSRNIHCLGFRVAMALPAKQSEATSSK